MADRNIADRLLGLLCMLCGVVLYFSGALIALGGLGLALYQCWLWLQDGRWTYFTIRSTFGEPPDSTWGGLAQIIDWVWSQPLAGELFAGGFVLIGLAILVMMIEEDLARA